MPGLNGPRAAFAGLRRAWPCGASCVPGQPRCQPQCAFSTPPQSRNAGSALRSEAGGRGACERGTCRGFVSLLSSCVGVCVPCAGCAGVSSSGPRFLSVCGWTCLRPCTSPDLNGPVYGVFFTDNGGALGDRACSLFSPQHSPVPAAFRVLRPLSALAPGFSTSLAPLPGLEEPISLLSLSPHQAEALSPGPGGRRCLTRKGVELVQA